MYKITQDNHTVGYAEALVFTRLAQNGCYVECPHAQAQGFVYNGQVYAIAGTEGYAGEPVAAVSEFDGGNALTALQGAVDGLLVNALMGGDPHV